ncbi:MAG: hypothetical protein IPN13_07970 [Bacteroidetes bacterium]|nr:hypothetical protein [Bacteroidota bacterium]
MFVDTSLNIRNMYFIDTISGFTCGDNGMILKTIDGGSNWQYLNTGIATRLNAIFFKSGQVGFCGRGFGCYNSDYKWRKYLGTLIQLVLLITSLKFML